MKIGIIDLGTNTFTILIVEVVEDKSFKEILRDRIHVNLASEGISTIGEKPFDRGRAAMCIFAEKLNAFEVKKVRAVGTAALRTASNGLDFVKKVKEDTGITIEIIDGNKEASLIYGGVSTAYPFGNEDALIMDIGGGSVEFILANKDGFRWKQSFPIGVAVLYNQFHHSNPMSAVEIDATRIFLEENLQPLFAILEKYPVKTLIGASGTFDVLERIYVKEKINALYTSVSTANAYDFYDQVKDKTEAERLLIGNFAPERNVMIVVAMVLMTFVIEKCRIESVVACAYAMKEGILKEIIHSEAS